MLLAPYGLIFSPKNFIVPGSRTSYLILSNL